MIGLHAQGRAVRRFPPQQLVPPPIAALRPGNVSPGAPVHDHMPDTRRQADGLVGGLLHEHGIAPAREAVGGDEHPGLAILQTRGHGLSAIAGKAGCVDGADTAHGQGGYSSLGRHRQEDPHRIAGADAKGTQCVGETVHVRGELAIAQRAYAAVLGLADDGRPVTAGGEMTIDAVGGEVDLAALEPARPRDATGGVEHARERTHPDDPQIVADRAPVPFRVLDRAGMECGQLVEPVSRHEPPEPATRGELRRRPPQNRLSHIHPLTAATLTHPRTPLSPPTTSSPPKSRGMTGRRLHRCNPALERASRGPADRPFSCFRHRRPRERRARARAPPAQSRPRRSFKGRVKTAVRYFRRRSP
jgi:hypothetical protein